MRRIKPEFKFDLWIKPLSPSTKLLADFKDGEIDWELFSKKFTKQVLNRQGLYLDMILEIAKNHKVTLLCWEEKGEKCHRLLITRRLEKMSPGLEIKHL